MAITKTKSADDFMLVGIALVVFMFFTALRPLYYATSIGGRFPWGVESADGWMETQPTMIGVAGHCVVAALVTWVIFSLVIDKEEEEDDTPVVECDSNDSNDTNCACPDTNDSNLCDSNGAWL